MYETVIKEISKAMTDPRELSSDKLKTPLSASKKELMNYENIANTDYSQINDVHSCGIDTLKEKIISVHPEFNEQNINKLKGDISENMMDEYFRNSGWSKKEGEVGINGIDGLYVKRNSEGEISKVMMVESKYNTSKLGDTQFGTQMSKEWIQAKLDNLIKAYPDDSDYESIKNMVANDKYRARLWAMNEMDNKLYINLKNINSIDRNIEISPLNGNENYKINHGSNQMIDLQKPDTIYHSKLVNNYNIILDKKLYT